MTATKSKKRGGRPRGKNAKPVPVAETVMSRCPKCQSTERTGYNSVRSMQYSGETPDGKPFNFITWKRTSCAKCGQHRIDKIYENVV